MFSKWHCISYTSIVNASEYVMYTCSPCFDHGKRFLFQSHYDAMLIYVLSLVIEDSWSIVSFSVVEPPTEFIWTMVNYQMDDKALFNHLWKFILHSTNFGCVFIFIRAKSSWWFHQRLSNVNYGRDPEIHQNIRSGPRHNGRGKSSHCEDGGIRTWENSHVLRFLG